MGERTVTITSWECDICQEEAVHVNRPDGWADVTLWHNPGPDTRLMIGANCWKNISAALVEAKDPRKAEVVQTEAVQA